MWQGNFFSPVWVLLCVFKSEVVAKPFAQTSQICSLILSWTCLTWCFITIFVVKVFPQWTHSNLLFSAEAFTACSLSETISPPSIWGELSVEIKKLICLSNTTQYTNRKSAKCDVSTKEIVVIQWESNQILFSLSQVFHRGISFLPVFSYLLFWECLHYEKCNWNIYYIICEKLFNRPLNIRKTT